MSACYCEAVPNIKNKTEFLIVQHSRERDHAFNTARMVKKALDRCQLFFGNSEALSQIRLPLQPGVGVLYPSPQARTLSELPDSEKPSQLVIIDGTWSQARKMVRDIRQLDGLPHYKLAPTTPGQYRIRLEPTDTSLSTVEAAIEALRELEPETLGMDQLMTAFEQMVQSQLDHPRVDNEHYSTGPKSGHTVNIPHQLLGEANSIVVAYGEAAYREVVNATTRARHPEIDTAESNPQPPRAPLFWLAQRLGTSEIFQRALEPDVPLTDSFLQHLELTHSHFHNAISPQQFREDWRAFLRDGDSVAVYNHGTIRLLENIDANFETCLPLKSIQLDQDQPRLTLAELVEAKQLRSEPVDPIHGRAGKRLANAVALVKHLRSLKQAAAHS